MNKKIRKIIIIISIIFGLMYVIDTTLNLGIISSIERTLDNEAPIISTEELRSKYLLDEDYTLDITCEDNYDDQCSVKIIGIFDTSILGDQSIKLRPVDTAGNETTFIYNYEIVQNADGSMYIPLRYYDSIDGLTGDDLKTA